ncbi:hypothetical protein ALO_17456 [Acetonema longum DSM 6540]|uniref:Uncharacterized protein n=1 Tax=Acetonema longum DSM 6540 TaxID=1009370 RepID=F7NN08_9FIRM|nr:hypothetical protein ALO_17456 [Acetonema longum DSM 6540]
MNKQNTAVYNALQSAFMEAAELDAFIKNSALKDTVHPC